MDRDTVNVRFFDFANFQGTCVYSVKPISHVND